METDDGGASWEARSLDLPEEENFRLISIDFNGNEGWIVGQPGLLLHSDDGGLSWSRLLLDTKLPGEPYLVTALGQEQPSWPPTWVPSTAPPMPATSWQALVGDAAGAIRDLRRSPEGDYVSVSSLGNFFATWDPGQPTWQVHQRVSSQRVQSMGFQPDGNLWMVTRGAQLRFNSDTAETSDDWSKPVIPITNGYGYLDMAWDPSGAIWTGGGSGTLLDQPRRRPDLAEGSGGRPPSPPTSAGSPSCRTARASCWASGDRCCAGWVERRAAGANCQPSVTKAGGAPVPAGIPLGSPS